MRIGLQARLEEINRLLLVSQGVASSLEMQDTVKPVLEAIFHGCELRPRGVIAKHSSRYVH